MQRRQLRPDLQRHRLNKQMRELVELQRKQAERLEAMGRALDELVEAGRLQHAAP